MDENRISQVLRSLPREEASPYFTAGVLRRLREPRRREARARWLLAVATILILAVAFGAREGWHRYEHRQAVARLAALRAEHQALETELESLRALAAQAHPVVYLGSTRNVDLVLDLSQLSSEQRRRLMQSDLVDSGQPPIGPPPGEPTKPRRANYQPGGSRL
ncbi:MAG: hypothetical protein GY856_37780 [bacterium]|nr:hypothetical protein [bacterium]